MRARRLGAIYCLFLLAGCGHHQPAPVEERSAAPVQRLQSSDGTHVVRSGDTLYAIAFNYGVDARTLAGWNEIPSPYVIYPGQKLLLSAPLRSPGSKAAVQISTVRTPGQVTTRAVTDPAKVPAAKTPSTSRNTTPAPASDPKSWIWPAEGRVLHGYVAANPARNGLDIAGKEGQDILASAGGQVVYSGNGLIGYGELIIIKHSEKMLSAYAHNKVRLVNEGEQVSSGQKIAEMGRTAANDQLLHFEIRVRGKPVNPLSYLPEK